MSMKKSMKVLVALLALAAAATPAFALENEISGKFASFYAVSNYSTPNDFNGRLAKDAATTNWIDQRLRLFYTAKVDQNVKVVTKFELDYAYWGNSSYVAGRGQGGAIGADAVNLETKNIYLDWTIPAEKLNVKIGMQGNDDAFSGIIFGSDMAGIHLAHSYNNAETSVGFFRWNDATGNGLFGTNAATSYGLPGRNTQDLFSIDGSYNVSSDLKVGGAYYYIQDETPLINGSKVHTLGLTAATKVAGVNVNGFLLGQTGDLGSKNAKGYAAKIAANAAVGSGTVRADLLYVAGGKNQLYVTGEKVGYYDNEMMILSRDKNQTTIDNAIVYDLNNNGEGVIMAALGYDQTFSSTLSGSANIGFAMVANNEAANVNAATTMFGDPLAAVTSKHDVLGTEVNVELVKKATDNISLSGRAGYVFLGDHFASNPITGNPDNPYSIQAMVTCKF